MELSIITCTVPDRPGSLQRLATQIISQSHGLPVEHVIIPGDGTIGRKINKGFRQSKGRYVCVVDDDDNVSSEYVESLLGGISQGPDVVTFGLRLLKSDQDPRWLRATEDGPCMANHLCAWKREIALAAPCLPRNYGWDVVWSWAVRLGNPNPKEVHVPRVLYGYNYSPEGTKAQSPESIADSIDNNGARIKIVRIHDGRIGAGPSLDRIWVSNMEILDLTGCRRDVEVLKEIEFK